jgi:hypothetical protein
MCNSGIHCFNQHRLPEVYNRKKDTFLFIYLHIYVFIYLFTYLFTYLRIYLLT